MTAVYVVGIGLDGRDGLLPYSLDILKKADLIVASQRLLDTIDQQESEKWLLNDLSRTLEKVRLYIDHNTQSTVVILAVTKCRLTKSFSADRSSIPNWSESSLNISSCNCPKGCAKVDEKPVMPLPTSCKSLRPAGK